MSKMRVQEQRVTQIQADLKRKEENLQKKEDDLQQMMTDLRDHLKEISMQREVCTCVCVSVHVCSKLTKCFIFLRSDHLESSVSLLGG